MKKTISRRSPVKAKADCRISARIYENYYKMTNERELVTTLPDELQRYFAIAHKLSGLGVLVYDYHENHIHLSEEGCRILGVSYPLRLGYQDLFEIVHQEDKSRILTWFESSEENKPPLEFRIIRKDSADIRVVSANLLKERDINGSAIRIVATIQDVTRMTESEIFWTSVFEQAPISMWVSDSKGTFLKQNQSCRELLHIEDRDVVGTYNLFEDKITLSQGVMRFIEGVFTKGEVARFPLTYDISALKRDREVPKEEKTLYVTITPIIDHRGKVTNAVVQHVDVTEQRRAEVALRESEERYRTTLMSVGDGVIATDAEGKIRLMNPSAERLTGWKQEEAQGVKFCEVFKIVDEGSRRPSQDPVERVLSSGSVYELPSETELLARDGREFSVADSASAIRDDKQRIIGAVLVFRDITEKRRLLYEMQKTQKLDALGVLAGGIAHDFNNLLGGLFGYIDLAREVSDQDSLVKKYLDKALQVFVRTKDLTQQLLTFSKGGVPVRKTALLGPLLRNNVQFALSGSNVSFEFDLPENLWPCDYDENQIGQVIDNLVINAQQAMPFGGKIHIFGENLILKPGENPTLQQGGKFVRISIRDQGTGIPENILPRIFDPFFSTKAKGSGLGLSSAYSIMKRHNGIIEVESRVGEGSVFRLYFPASEGVIHFEKKTELEIHRGKGQVLILDDQEAIADVASHMLDKMGYGSKVVSDGDSAIREFEKALREDRRYCVVILDLTIPGGKGGKWVIEQIRKLDQRVPVVASSGYSDDPVMAKPEQFGFTASLPKPYRMNELAGLLSRILDKA